MNSKSFVLLLFISFCMLGGALLRDLGANPGGVGDLGVKPGGIGEMDVQNPFASKGRVLTENDVKKLTPKQVLDHFGFGNTIPDFTNMLEHAYIMFKKTTGESQFEMVNHILDALKKSLLKTVALVRQAPSPLPPVIDGEMMDQVVEVMEQHFHDALQRDPDVDLTQVETFFKTYADAFFNSLKAGYRSVLSFGISLTWTIVYMIVPFIERLDTNVIDREMFRDVLDAPDHLKQFLYDALAEIMTGDYAHFVQMAATFLSTIDLKKLMREKLEL